MYNVVHMVATTRCWAQTSTALTLDARRFLALMAFTTYTVLLYLVTRVTIARCFPFAVTPVALFPIHLLCDTYTEVSLLATYAYACV